jgi:hypothetical protein
MNGTVVLIHAAHCHVGGDHGPSHRIAIFSVRPGSSLDSRLPHPRICRTSNAFAYFRDRNPVFDNINQKLLRESQALRRIAAGVLKVEAQDHQMMYLPQPMIQLPETHLVKVIVAGLPVNPSRTTFRAEAAERHISGWREQQRAIDFDPVRCDGTNIELHTGAASMVRKRCAQTPIKAQPQNGLG